MVIATDLRGSAAPLPVAESVAEAAAVEDEQLIAATPAPVARRWRRGSWLRRNWIGIVSCAVVLSIWEVGARIADYPFLPPVSQILFSLQRIILNGSAVVALGESLAALATGLAIAIVSGVLLGTLTGLSRVARLGLSVYIDALMAAPMSAFVPLFIVLFGLTSATRILVVAVFAFFPIVVNTQAGIQSADPDLIMMAQSFGATRVQTFFNVRLPASYDHLQAGLRMAMARGVEGLIIGEVLIAAVGLGGLVTQYHHAFSTDRLFAVVVIIVALAFTLQALTRLACRLLLGMRY
jgi:NitT/TauT family transport system permease protein